MLVGLVHPPKRIVNETALKGFFRILGIAAAIRNKSTSY